MRAKWPSERRTLVYQAGDRADFVWEPQNESIESLLGNSFLPALSKDRRRPLKIRQLYTMNKALCEFTENLVDKATGDLNIENVTTYMNQLGSGRKIKSQNERDIKYKLYVGPSRSIEKLKCTKNITSKLFLK